MIYNHGMDSKQFIEKEEDITKAILSSDIYLQMKALSQEIDANDEIRALAEERDDLYFQSANERDEKKKREILIKAKEKDDKIQSFDIVKEYNMLYRKLRKILNHMTDSISEILR